MSESHIAFFRCPFFVNLMPPHHKHSDKFDIFKAEGDAVVLQDPEGCEMSRMKVIQGKRRARLGPQFSGSPTPEKKPRHR